MGNCSSRLHVSHQCNPHAELTDIWREVQKCERISEEVNRLQNILALNPIMLILIFVTLIHVFLWTYLYVYWNVTFWLPVKVEAEVNMLCNLVQPQKELQLDMKTNNTQNHQEIRLYGSLTPKDLKKAHSFRWVGGAESQRVGEKRGDVLWCREVVAVKRWSHIQLWWKNREGYVGIKQSQLQAWLPHDFWTQKFVDTHKSLEVTRGGGWRSSKGKKDQIYGDRRRFDFGW